MGWPLGRSWTSYCHYRNPDRPPVVHLCRSQGCSPPAPSSSPRDARLPEGQAGRGSAVISQSQAESLCPVTNERPGMCDMTRSVTSYIFMSRRLSIMLDEENKM